jgi:hypothetical protein
MNKNSFSYTSPTVKIETVGEYLEREGAVTVCRPGRAEGTGIAERWIRKTCAGSLRSCQTRPIARNEYIVPFADRHDSFAN